jgi:hypothetical protein
MLVYQRVDHINITLNHYKIPLNHHKSHCITIYQRVDPFFFPPFCHSRPGWGMSRMSGSATNVPLRRDEHF